MNRRVAIVLLIVVVTGVVALAYYAYQQTLIGRQPLAASGTVEATEVNVSSQIAARITSVGSSEGDRVKKNHVIVRLDSRLLANQVKQAKAGISAAKAALSQTKDTGTDADIAAARAQLRQARLTYQMALVQLSYATVRAPISGTVLSVPVNAGENANPGSTLVVLGDLRTVHVDVFIPEPQLGFVKLNQKADVAVDSFPGQVFTGRVTVISSQAEFTPANVETKEQRVKQVFRVTVNLANADQKLKPGMPADVAFR